MADLVYVGHHYLYLSQRILGEVWSTQDDGVFHIPGEDAEERGYSFALFTGVGESLLQGLRETAVVPEKCKPRVRLVVVLHVHTKRNE